MGVVVILVWAVSKRQERSKSEAGMSPGQSIWFVEEMKNSGNCHLNKNYEYETGSIKRSNGK